MRGEYRPIALEALEREFALPSASGAVFGPRPASLFRLSKTECLRAVQDGYARATWTRGQMREFRYRAQKARPRVSKAREQVANIDRGLQNW